MISLAMGILAIYLFGNWLRGRNWKTLLWLGLIVQGAGLLCAICAWLAGWPLDSYRLIGATVISPLIVLSERVQHYRTQRQFGQMAICFILAILLAMVAFAEWVIGPTLLIRSWF